ncbi:MAG: peptidylprolyl isomerase [Acidobacteria bacterium]|nr:peptidylprolyl isomerase [Acidobacteriota bacterium]
MRKSLTFAIGVLVLVATVAHAQAGRGAAAGPVLVLDTVKGPIEIQLFASDAPKSVEHIVGLVKRSFYRSQRFHRVEPTLVQFGDPQSRDMTKQGSWGTGSSYNPIGVAELSKRTHVRGTVGLANSGNPKTADSQLYIMKAPSPSLNGKHVIVGQVIKGMDVVDKLQYADMIKLVAIKEAGQK